MGHHDGYLPALYRRYGQGRRETEEKQHHGRKPAIVPMPAHEASQHAEMHRPILLQPGLFKREWIVQEASLAADVVTTLGLKIFPIRAPFIMLEFLDEAGWLGDLERLGDVCADRDRPTVDNPNG